MKKNVICDVCENIGLLDPYINKPVYIKGYCWNRVFDGWAILYVSEPKYGASDLVFDYRGRTYSAYGFLPGLFTLSYDSKHNNAFYKEEW